MLGSTWDTTAARPLGGGSFYGKALRLNALEHAKRALLFLKVSNSRSPTRATPGDARQDCWINSAQVVCHATERIKMLGRAPAPYCNGECPCRAQACGSGAARTLPNSQCWLTQCPSRCPIQCIHGDYQMPCSPTSAGCAPQLLEHKAGGDHGGSNAARRGVVKPHRRHVFGRPSDTHACPSRQDVAKH